MPALPVERGYELLQRTGTNISSLQRNVTIGGSFRGQRSVRGRPSFDLGTPTRATPRTVTSDQCALGFAP